jgi:hypothetical protein
MRLSLTIIALLAITLPSYCSNRIDSLVTEGQVEAFIRTLHPGYITFRLTKPGTSFTDSVFSDFVHNKQIPNHDKADLDGNGESDLVVLGETDPGGVFSIVVVDTGMGYDVVPFSENFLGQKAVLAIEHDSVNLLHVFRAVTSNSAPTRIAGRILIYRFGGFVEFNPRPDRKEISRIQFTVSPGYGNSPFFGLELFADGRVLYTAREGNPVNGTFCGVVDQEYFSELCALMCYIDPDSTRAKSSTDLSDLPAFRTLIEYRQENKSVIEDYGSMGTYGLQLFYTKMWLLRQNTAWTRCD